jgi:uncharacterized protein
MGHDEQSAETLVTACELHTDAERANDLTMGVCWDSDRLNLWRVGTTPSPRYLSTVPGRDADRIDWARKLQRSDIPWTQVQEAYSQLPASCWHEAQGP